MSERAFLRTQFTAILSEKSVATLLQRIAAAGVSVLAFVNLKHCEGLRLIKFVVGLPNNPSQDINWANIVRGILAQLRSEEKIAACEDPCAPEPLSYSSASVVYLNFEIPEIPGILSAWTTALFVNKIKIEAMYNGETTSVITQVPQDRLAQALQIAQNLVLPIPPQQS